MTNPSIARLLERLDADTAPADRSTICAAVKRTLIEQIGTGTLELPADLTQPSAEAYARRLLHKGDDYAIVVMVWGEGQGTPIHDHDGQWCVECVYSGTIRVQSFDLIGEPSDARVGFRAADSVLAKPGMAGSLIPPFDYHVIENAGTGPAVTVHVYGGEMQGCNTYERDADGSFSRQRRALRYTGE